MPEPLPGLFGNCRNDHPGVTVTDQYAIVKIFALDYSQNISNVRVEVDLGAKQMGALTQAGERWREHLVAGFTQERSNSSPVPAPMPPAVQDPISSHYSLLQSAR